MSPAIWVYVVAAVAGILAGLLGAAFHYVLNHLDEWRESLRLMLQHGQVALGPFTFGDWRVEQLPGWAVLMACGAVLVGLGLFLVRALAPETAGSGIQEVEGVLKGWRRLRWYLVIPVKFIGGGLAIASGLVLGREGPTIHMGAAAAKMSALICRLDQASTKALVAAGAGAGLTAAFNAPLAGIIFVIEEMREDFDFNFLSFNSVVLSCCMAEIVNGLWLGQGPFLPLVDFPTPAPAQLVLFALLGILIGLFGVVFNALLVGGLDFFQGIPKSLAWLNGLLVGAAFGALVWFAPDTTGGGESLVELLTDHHLPVLFLLGLLAARILTTVVSYGVGVPGGIFAPMLALGTITGMAFGQLVQGPLPGLAVDSGAYAVAAMGALFAATVQAPLTGIVLVTELTGNHRMILAIILTCLLASIVAKACGARPIYRVLLERARRREGLDVAST